MDSADYTVEEMCDLEAGAKRVEKTTSKKTVHSAPKVVREDPEVEEMISDLLGKNSSQKPSSFFMVKKGNPAKIVELSSSELPKEVRDQGSDDIQEFSNRTLRSAELLTTAFTSHEFAKACLDAYLGARK
ncbi:MAG TPA: hypothetical protein PKA63_01055 [Oligoflexia bacterium]|nr:hypothetical protein [Oligoflexia bacterium]HMP47237.1 hypothetical protein [Oligoflexia bacterium]